ncbi:hypothetical protein BJY00DRAFT_313201 [Aspergillus carlsbadensis]|nr:hypothetical protein BJY00DRAFT_313201 [Aspergillus carlsbadensis]
MLTLLFLPLSLFTFTLAVPSHEACGLLADYTQNQLTNISPLLQYTATSLESSNEPRDLLSARQSKSPEVTNYLNALSDALAQIGFATGSSSDQFRSEITQACGDDASRKRSEFVDLEVRQDTAPLLHQVYSSLSVVVDYSRRHRDGLDGLLGGLLDSVGDLLEGVLDAVGDLLDGLGLGGLLDDLLDALL